MNSMDVETFDNAFGVPNGHRKDICLTGLTKNEDYIEFSVI